MIRRMIRILPEEGYDLMAIEGFYCLHVCSECNGTREVTGHKYWCNQGKKYQKQKEDKG